jgi:hypothetical protein
MYRFLASTGKLTIKGVTFSFNPTEPMPAKRAMFAAHGPAQFITFEKRI